MALQHFIPELWSEQIQIAKKEYEVFVENTNRRYEGTLAAKGDSVKILGIKKVPVHDLARSNGDIGAKTGALTRDLIEDDSYVMPVTQIRYYNYALNDFDKRQAIDGVMSAAQKSVAQQLANETDKYIAGQALKVNNKTLSPVYTMEEFKLTTDGGTFATPVVEATITDDSQVLKVLDDAAQKLYELNLPASSKLVATVTPEFYFALKRAYTGLDTDNSKMLKNGYVGTYGNIDIKMSNNVAKDETEFAHIMVKTDEAVAYVESAIHSESYRVEAGFLDAVKGYILFDAAIVRPDEIAIAKVKFGD